MLKVIMWLIITVIHNLAYYVDATVKPSSESKNLHYYLASTYVLEERKCHDTVNAMKCPLKSQHLITTVWEAEIIGGRYDGQGFVIVK